MGDGFEIGAAARVFSTLHLNLDLGFNTRLHYLSDIAVAARIRRAENHTDMSSGYTRALASTAPVAPAMALSHGESFDCPVMEEILQIFAKKAEIIS